MSTGQPSLAARWLAAQRLRLERSRPSTPSGDIEAERRLYRALAGSVSVPVGRATALAQRTQVIDAEVARALGQRTPQIVLLGAGGDGRALRFGGGVTRWFEVDRPAAQADKRNRLVELGIATPATTYVPLDLLDGGLGPALAAAGHDAGAPTLFVAEDVFDSLTLEATASACADLRARATPESTLVAGCTVQPEGGGAVKALRTAAGLLRQATAEPRRNDLRPGDPQKLLVVTGWRVTHAEASAQRHLDPGAHSLVVLAAPDPSRHI